MIAVIMAMNAALDVQRRAREDEEEARRTREEARRREEDERRRTGIIQERNPGVCYVLGRNSGVCMTYVYSGGKTVCRI